MYKILTNGYIKKKSRVPHWIQTFFSFELYIHAFYQKQLSSSQLLRLKKNKTKKRPQHELGSGLALAEKFVSKNANVHTFLSAYSKPPPQLSSDCYAKHTQKVRYPK